MKHSNKADLSSPQIEGATCPGNASAVRRISSDLLLAGRRELVIEHGSEEYRLRITRQGKLILTK